MKTIKNCPTEVAKSLASLIEYEAKQVVSMALTNSEHVQISMFTFADGEMVSSESYVGDTLYLLIEGATKITIGEQSIPLRAGELFAVGAGEYHSIGGTQAFKMMQITVNS